MSLDAVGLNNYYIIPDVESNNGNFMFAPVRYLREARVDFSLEGVANLMGKAAIITGLALSILALGVGIYLIYKTGQEWNRQETLLDKYKITKATVEPTTTTDNQQTSNANDLSGQAQAKPETTPPAQKTEAEISPLDTKMKDFKKAALESLKNPQVEKPDLDFSLSGVQVDKLKLAYGKKDDPVEGFKTLRGVNRVYFLDNIPNFVFKHKDNCRGNIAEDQPYIDKYMKDVASAQKCIEENNLYLLQLPQTQVITIDNMIYIQQEKLNLFSGDYYQQKGIYSYCWNDEEMKPYITKLFEQLTIFISKTNFSDVKFDNIPLTSDAKVALIDLDSTSAQNGIAGKKGLFSMIPPQYVDDFIKVAKKSLEKEVFEKLEQKLVEIKEKTIKRQTNRKEYSQFLKDHLITTISQKINPDFKRLFKDDDEQRFAMELVAEINENLSKANNVLLNVGRKVLLYVASGSKIIEFASRNTFANTDFAKLYPRDKILHVMKILQENKCIFDYQLKPMSYTLRVRC